jgi:hypothetical protein
MERGVKLGHGFYQAYVWTDALHNTVRYEVVCTSSCAPLDSKRIKGGLEARIHKTAKELSEAYKGT